jgi:CDP-diacylglycerol--glycerol-3-phosphate 3-phosphatidyltransferase
MRALLTLPAAMLLWNGYNFIALAIGILCYITDILDGWLARKLDEITEVGKIIDPLADKIFVGVITSILVIQDRLPLWFVAGILLRDAVIILVGLYITKRTGFVLPSNYPGKAAVFCIVLTMVCVVAELPALFVTAGIAVSSCMLLVSFILYAIRAVHALRTVP